MTQKQIVNENSRLNKACPRLIKMIKRAGHEVGDDLLIPAVLILEHVGGRAKNRSVINRLKRLVESARPNGLVLPAKADRPTTLNGILRMISGEV